MGIEVGPFALSFAQTCVDKTVGYGWTLEAFDNILFATKMAKDHSVSVLTKDMILRKGALYNGLNKGFKLSI